MNATYLQSAMILVHIRLGVALQRQVSQKWPLMNRATSIVFPIKISVHIMQAEAYLWYLCFLNLLLLIFSFTFTVVIIYMYYSQGCHGVKRWPWDLDLWPWKLIGFQIFRRTKYLPSLVKIYWKMLILECSQGYYAVNNLTRWPWPLTYDVGNQQGSRFSEGLSLCKVWSQSIERCWF